MAATNSGYIGVRIVSGTNGCTSGIARERSRGREHVAEALIANLVVPFDVPVGTLVDGEERRVRERDERDESAACAAAPVPRAS